jgi:integrase
LSEGDISKMIENCNHPRDKALISCFYEGGLRASELLTMKIGDVNFDNRGCFIMVRGKTGPRRVRLITSHYLSDWIACLPSKTPETPIWTSLSTNHRGKPFTYTSLRNLLRKIAQRAEIRKRVNPHIFRHSRASQLANKLTESQLNEHFGWVQGSDMTRIYVHLSGRNLDNALLESQEPLKLILCPRCGQQIQTGHKFCFSCGLPLDMQTNFSTTMKMDKLETLLLKIDIEKLEKILRD